jgi:diguanylate cyclase (GGDEF)-like protein
MTMQDRPRQTEASTLMAVHAGAASVEAVQQLLPIRRIGKRLFGVANCLITFGDAGANSPENERSMASIEAAFCYSIPQPLAPVVVTDTRNEQSLRGHRLVFGAPYIRFYVAYPIHDSDGVAIGSISLIDYAPRAFSEEDQLLLADLTRLVERELQVRSMNAFQLDLQRKNKTLRRKSLIDPLIGTWNRGAIMRILAVESVRCDKLGEPLSLIVLDLDFFKRINDSYGHPAGDSVLVKVASRLRSCIRPAEALGRYGGEEFLVVLPATSQATAMAVAERMRRAIAEQPEVIGGATFNLSISAGVASTEIFPAATAEELISRADVALYAAKDAGRNCVMQANPMAADLL